MLTEDAYQVYVRSELNGQPFIRSLLALGRGISRPAHDAAMELVEHALEALVAHDGATRSRARASLAVGGPIAEQTAGDGL